MLTKEWLKTDADFNELLNRLETYSGFCKCMKILPAKVSIIISFTFVFTKIPFRHYLTMKFCYLQSFASDMHHYVVKGYISELMKNKFSCKGKTNDIAAEKIKEQYRELNKLFKETVSY